MSNLDMFRDLLHCVTYRDLSAPLPQPHVRLNHVFACDWQVNGERPIVGEWRLRPIVISAYPNNTLPQLLAPLLEYRGYPTLSIRFRCLERVEAQKQLEQEKAFSPQSALGNFVKSFFGWDKSDDQDAKKQIKDLNDAIAESQDGMPFGTISTVAVVRDKDPNQADLRAHNLMGVLNGKGIVARIETIGAAKAIRSTWPGYLQMKSEEYEANRHKLKMTGYNFAGASMPASYWAGTPTIHSTMFPVQTPTPLVCGGSADVPFHFPTHVNGVSHILGIGMTGSGKSIFAALYVCALLSIPSVRVAWMDSARSSYIFSQLLSAEYHDVGSKTSLPLCPLMMLDREGWLEWLFFRRKGFELDEQRSKDLMNALRDVRMRKHQGATNARGCNLLDLYAAMPGGDKQRNRIRRILDEMIGVYGYIFAGEPTEAEANRITIYELSNLKGVPKYNSTPAKELIFQNIIANLDGSPAWIFADEFWSLLGDEVSAEWLFDSIRTVRKRNCGFIGCTQSLTEIVNSPYRDLLLESCPGKILLPNHEARGEYVRDSYRRIGLNDHEIAIISSARPQREYFYRSSIGNRLFALALGDVAKNLCAATGYKDVATARRLLAESPNGLFLDTWLSERLPNWQYRLPVTAETEAVAGR